MLHVLHLIRRRRGGHALPYAVPLSVVSATALLTGLGFLLGH